MFNNQQTSTYQTYITPLLHSWLPMQVFTNVRFFSFKHTAQTLHSLHKQPKQSTHWDLEHSNNHPLMLQSKCDPNLKCRLVLMVFCLAELKTKALKSLWISSRPFYLKLGRIILSLLCNTIWSPFWDTEGNMSPCKCFFGLTCESGS